MPNVAFNPLDSYYNYIVDKKLVPIISKISYNNLKIRRKYHEMSRTG
jgi:DUF1365 family protein